MLLQKFPSLAEPGGPAPVTRQQPLTVLLQMSEEEVKAILMKQSNRSSPGVDGIGYKALKILNKLHPNLQPTLYNSCLAWSVFPERWKIGRLVIIPKSKSCDPTMTSSYRPLTMLPTLGKVLEQCMTTRTKTVTEVKLSPTQYGFRKGRSCEDCIMAVTKNMEKMKKASELMSMVALDIKGAFDHILWDHIIQQLVVYGVPEYMVKLSIQPTSTIWNMHTEY